MRKNTKTVRIRSLRLLQLAPSVFPFPLGDSPPLVQPFARSLLLRSSSIMLVLESLCSPCKIPLVLISSRAPLLTLVA